MRALIRTDANPEVALGHLKRCVALAHKLSEKGVFVSILACRDESAERLLRESGLDHSFLDAPTNSDQDCSLTLARAEALGAETVIVDCYGIDNSYRQRLKESGLFVAAITDLPYMDLVAHAIINGNLNAERHAGEAPAQALTLLGIRHLILGKCFWRPAGVHDGLDAVRDILITFGGIDHYDLTSRIIAMLDRFEGDFQVTAIIGPYYDNIASIEAQASRSRKRVRLVRSPSDLQEYMRTCSFAFSAGGQALYELASLGRPMIGIALWENQEANVRALSSMGAIRGLVRSLGPEFEDELTLQARRLFDDPAERERLSRAAASLIDAQGAERVSVALIQENAQWQKLRSQPSRK